MMVYGVEWMVKLVTDLVGLSVIFNLIFKTDTKLT